MMILDNFSRSISYLCFLIRQLRRRSKQLLTGRGRHKHHIVHHMKLVPSRDLIPAIKPKEDNNLLFYFQNISGLSDQFCEEAIHLMDRHNVCVSLLQETWRGVSANKCKYEDMHNGYLFLLHGN